MTDVHKLKKERIWNPMMLAFAVPVLVLFILYIVRGVYPFGKDIYVRMDFYHQYAPFVKDFCRRLWEGESFFYAWEYGLGANYWAHYAYYLASPFNWLIALIPTDYVIEAMNVTMVLRAGIAGASFVYFLKENNEENISMAVFGVFYALSGYYLAYSCNIIWMDGYALFPLVALGVMRIAKGKSSRLYLITMLISTFSNFYLAVIMGMCCVIWLAVCVVFQEKIKGKDVLRAVGKFVGATLLYVAMCAVILLPVAYALMNTPAGEGGYSEQTNVYFHFYELFERMCMNCASNLKGSKLPNIYASVPVLFLLPVYFCNKKISLKKKLVFGTLMAFLLAGFNVNLLDYIWHGLHFPNSFPARQSFFYIFIVLTMGYEAFKQRKDSARWVYYLSVVLLAVVIELLWYFTGLTDGSAATKLYLYTLIFVILYGALFICEKMMPPKVFLILFMMICCGEAVINTCHVGLDSLITRSVYMDDDVETETLLPEIMPGEDEFYRIEEQDRRTVNDAAWDGYYGASYFSSTMPGGMKEWYDAFGMRTSSVSYSYDGATPLITSLLGIRYVFACEDGIRPAYTFTETVIKEGDDEKVLYENETVLPLGYVVAPEVEAGFQYDYGNPFVTQNDYVSAVLGREAALFETVPQFKETELVQFEMGAGVETKIDTDDADKTCIHVKAGENVYIYVTTYMESIALEIIDLSTGEKQIRRPDDLKFKKIIPIGVADTDRLILVSSTDTAESVVEFYSYKMNEDILKETCAILGSQPMEIDSFSGCKIKGSVNAKEEGALLLSIPYDKGWTVKVDGKKTEAYAWKDAFMAIDLQPGYHEISFHYCPVGFVPGLCISLSGIATAVVLCLNDRRKKGQKAESIPNKAKAEKPSKKKKK